MYSSSLFQFYETRQRKLWKWWHIYKQHVILICRGALVAFKSIATSAQHSMALSYGKIHICENSISQGYAWSQGWIFLVIREIFTPGPGRSHWVKNLPFNLSASRLSSWNPGFHQIPTDQKKSFTLNHTLAILHCSRSKNLFSHIVPFLGTTWVTFFLFPGISRVCLRLRAATPSKLWEEFWSKSEFEISLFFWVTLSMFQSKT